VSGTTLAAPLPPPTRVLICDDSAVVREALTRLLESDSHVQVVARASNGQAALDALVRTRVDVVLLDIQMPIMDGLTALPLLLRAAPGVRVIMASALTQQGAGVALRALRDGAVDYLPKPGIRDMEGDGFRRELLAKVKGHASLTRAPASPGAISLRPAGRMPRLLAVASSTGGPRALFDLLHGLSAARRAVPVPIVVTQHMPPSFTPMLAEHLARAGGLPCAEARHGEWLQPGALHLAPGDRHLLVRRTADGALQARLSDGPPESFCRPSADPMLRSAAEACDGRVLVVVLTGMGQDGLAGTRAVIEAGGTALAQDEASSVVWGMPGSVAKAGLCHAVLPVPELAARALELLPGSPS
jgi:two-component system, chemotaxis family, protein-glutamate methylesterase/glutaminase